MALSMKVGDYRERDLMIVPIKDRDGDWVIEKSVGKIKKFRNGN